MADHTWHVGQQVYVVPTDKRWSTPYTAEVVKIGRVYGHLATTNDGRSDRDIEFKLANGVHKSGEYTPRYTVYPSEAAYREAVQREAVRERVRRYFSPYGQRTELTDEDYAVIAAILDERGVP